MTLVIDKPECDWAALPFKKKHLGSVYRCRACGHWGKGKTPPECPCKPIEVPDSRNSAVME